MKSLRNIENFRNSEDGAIMVFVAVALSVILGMAAIAFDFGRVTTTHAELQSFADNVALAAAGELDGQVDSITRASNAAANMITDSQTFGVRNKDQALTVDDFQLFFYSKPADPDAPIAQAAELLDPTLPASGTLAAFVRVLVDDHEIDTPLAAATAALVDDGYRFATVSAEAVAGFSLVACDITPMFFCLPPDLNVAKGQMIKMVSQGGGASAQWGPGNFGFLEASETVGIDPDGACDPAPPGQEDACALAASEAVSLCFSQTGVTTKPGLSVGNMIAGLNTRFDQYDSAAGQFSNDKKYDPANFSGAPIVIDGVITKSKGNQCEVTAAPPLYDADGNIDATATIPLPLDPCFAAGNCPQPRISGVINPADLQEYKEVNYDPTGVKTANQDPSDPLPQTWVPTGATRYDIYLDEIANLSKVLESFDKQGKVESHLPSCQQPPATEPLDLEGRRRVIIAAGVDCNTYQDELKGGSGVIPVKRFVEMFLVRPAESDGTGAAAVVWGEVIDSVSEGDPSGKGGILHDLVQLYE